MGVALLSTFCFWASGRNISFTTSCSICNLYTVANVHSMVAEAQGCAQLNRSLIQ